MKEEYVLLNKDEELVRFRIVSDNRGCERTELIRCYRKPFWMGDLNAFFHSRRAPMYRAHMEHLFKQCDCRNLKRYLEFTHGLGLNDTLWVRRADEELEWKTVSLYANVFDENIGKIAFLGEGYLGRVSCNSPELSTDGQFAKCWLRENRDIFLMKQGSSGTFNAGLEPYSEFYGSEIISRICDKAVKYDLTGYYGKICTKSRLFTSEDYGYVPMRYFKFGTSLSELADFLKKLGFFEQFCHMIVGDTVICNEDRHLGNFGVIMDNRTFDIVDFAPVFDHNLCLLCYGDDKDLENFREYFKLCNKGHKLGVLGFVEDGKKFLDSRSRKRLRSLLDYSIRKHGKYDLEEWRIDRLNQIIHNQVKGLLE